MNLIDKIDNRVIHFVNSHLRNKYLDYFMMKMTKLGNFDFIWILISIVLVLLTNYKLVGFKTSIAMILCALLGEGILKYTIRRARPFKRNKNLKIIILKPKTYSFPSGHTSSSVAVAYLLSIYFSQFAILVWGLAIIISLSRIYLCVHYFSDVLVGAILGVVCAVLTLIICNEQMLSYLNFMPHI